MTTTLTSSILAVSNPNKNPRRIVVMENRTTAPEDLEAAMSEIVRTNGKILEEHLGEMVRSTVEETLNGLLDAEADHICGAERYERNPDKVDSRSGHYQRKLMTKAGEVKLKVPKLRKLPFESAIIERYCRRERSVEESIVEMYLAGISVRRVESITEARKLDILGVLGKRS